MKKYSLLFAFLLIVAGCGGSAFQSGVGSSGVNSNSSSSGTNGGSGGSGNSGNTGGSGGSGGSSGSGGSGINQSLLDKIRHDNQHRKAYEDTQKMKDKGLLNINSNDDEKSNLADSIPHLKPNGILGF